MAQNSSEIKQRLSVFFNGNEDMMRRYIESYGEELSMKNIKELRQKVEDEAAEAEEPGEDPLYTIELECPVCKNLGIEYYEMRAKSQFLYHDQFMTPMYKGINGYKTVNFAHYAMGVCPKCLFASPDKKDFCSVSLVTKQKVASKVPPIVLGDLLEGMGERLTILEELPDKDGLFQFPRSAISAINSYRLAIERVNVELRHRLPYSYYKLGSYWTRIALIERLAHMNDEASLEMAAESFKKAFLNSDFPNPDLEFQSVYIIFAIYMRLDLMDEGRKYMALFDTAKSDFENGVRHEPSGLSAVKKWKDKAVSLWESREDDDLWDIPKPRGVN